MNATTIGIDLAKSVFQVHDVDTAGQVTVSRAFVQGSPCVLEAFFVMLRNFIADTPCAPQRTVATFQPNRNLEVTNRACITDRTIATAATATARASDARIALSTLILAVSLVLLHGAVWMHAT